MQKAVHAEGRTCRRPYMQKAVHAEGRTCRRPYMQKAVHAEGRTCRRPYMQKAVHAEGRTCRRPYMQKAVHAEGCTSLWLCKTRTQGLCNFYFEIPWVQLKLYGSTLKVYSSDHMDESEILGIYNSSNSTQLHLVCCHAIFPLIV